jgi:hypothetical protein
MHVVEKKKITKHNVGLEPNRIFIIRLIRINCVNGQSDVCLASAIIYIIILQGLQIHILNIEPLAQDRKSVGMSSLLLQLHFRRNDKSC